MKRLLALCLLACATYTHASDAVHTAEQQRITLENANASGATQALRGWWFAAPDKNAPAVIALHGCGGLYDKNGALNTRHAAMAEYLQQHGYAVLYPDSFTDRGFKTLCAIKFSERTFTQHDRLPDIAAAVRWLAANTQAPHNFLLGWSHGGGVTLAAMDARTQLPELAKINKAVAFYPGCSRYTKRGDYTPRAPLLIQIGAEDDWTPTAPCKALDGQGQAPRAIRTVVYPGAVHDFDTPNQPVRRRMDVRNGVNPGQGVLTGSNPQAREAAYAEMLRFFAEKQ